MIPLWLGLVALALGVFFGSLRAPRRRYMSPLVDDTSRFRALRAGVVRRG